MIRINAAVMALLFGGTVVSRAGQPAEGAVPEVIVHMVDDGLLVGSVRVRAKAIATAILASAGVRLRWEKSNVAPMVPIRTCGAGGIATTITVRFVKNADPTASHGALAAATPFAQDGVGIFVFYDRLQPMFDLLKQPEYLLGHVLAHEIGHQLMGTDSHSETGLMKARWSAMDIYGMPAGRMKFTPEFAQMIRRNLADPCTQMAGGRRQ